VVGCARMDTSAEDRPERRGLETHSTFTIFSRKAHTSTVHVVTMNTAIPVRFQVRLRGASIARRSIGSTPNEAKHR
jgi:hypothetical protein